MRTRDITHNPHPSELYRYASFSNYEPRKEKKREGLRFLVSCCVVWRVLLVRLERIAVSRQERNLVVRRLVACRNSSSLRASAREPVPSVQLCLHGVLEVVVSVTALS